MRAAGVAREIIELKQWVLLWQYLAGFKQKLQVIDNEQIPVKSA